MPHAVFAAGHTALITGAASGIGLAVAQMCARHGMRLALVDLDAAALDSAKQSMPAEADVTTYTADVSQQEAWKALKQQVDAKLGPVHFLVLNAGIAASGTWEDVDYFHKIINTNLFGVINGLSTFLPSVKAAAASSPAAIVITGSKQGITNPPGNPAYNASKAAVRSLAEHLAFDLRHDPVSVHLLVPGWTFTGLARARGVREKPPGAWTAAQVADYLALKMEQGLFYAVCPDNDVSEDLDRRRVLYGAGDLVYGRMPLSRWREESKDAAAKAIEGMEL